MEHRLDLEQLLLAGLPEPMRHDTVRTIRAATTKKLNHLRRNVIVEDDDWITLNELPAGMRLLPRIINGKHDTTNALLSALLRPTIAGSAGRQLKTRNSESETAAQVEDAGGLSDSATASGGRLRRHLQVVPDPPSAA